MRGIPVVGDVNGDGSDDLITYDAGADTFYIDLDRDGSVDDTIHFGIPDFVERPVVGDLNLDGVDDLGLWVAGNAQKIGEGKAEWYFLVSDRVATPPDEVGGEGQPDGLASPLFDPYSPDPLGNDLFANYGDRYSLPIFGNFDPPVAGGDGTGGGHLISYTNAHLPLDVNSDGVISPLDALIVINRLNATGTAAVPNMMVEYQDASPFVDVNADRFVSPADALKVINYLNRLGDGGEGEAANVEPVLAADSYQPELAIDALLVVPMAAQANRSNPSRRDATAGGIADLAATSNIAATPSYVGQAANQQTTIGDTDEWLGEEMDLEEVLELIADQVRSNWWDS